MFVVLRKACLMEDEGRNQYYGSYSTLEEAKQAIEEFSENDKGYFRRSNFTILEEVK